MTPARVLSTNVAVPRPDPAGADRYTGISKRLTAQISVFTPGPSYGDGSGVEGDFIGDRDHHGGEQKAVYAYAREQLHYWSREFGRILEPGSFGENITTAGVDLEALLINQRLRIGTAVFEVSVPRTPCRTFAAHLGVPQWVQRFTEHGRCGTYLRVVESGKVTPGDSISLDGHPGHDITMYTAFAAAMGDDDAAALVVAAECLPPYYHERLVRRLAPAAEDVSS
ncbi:MOSC domain-containing protein [Austwickia sp. TVS 96-490-7B]|uniref:MOSC domain-containing protein n=1 Tax=Austwickia sp. TVS 96-490-7B TaxID=2830843 RepID=UPI001C5913AA|nr:MOSC domain-containing protein [Austwickia sp. TVS 96-490-7B]